MLVAMGGGKLQIDFERLHPQSLGHDRGEKIDAKKKKMMWRSVWGC